jgi:hypothetical protein
MTSPVYHDVENRPRAPDPEAGRYFGAWVDAVKEGFEAACSAAAEAGEPLPESERAKVEDRLAEARRLFDAEAATE